MGSKKEAVLRALIELAKKKKGPITVSDIYNYMDKSGIVSSKKWIRLILEKLVAEGKVQKITSRRLVYYIPKQTSILDYLQPSKPETREEIGARIAREEALLEFLRRYPTRSVSEEIGKQIELNKLFPSRVEKMIEEIAEKIAHENPRKLLKEMFEDLLEMFKEYAEKYRNIRNKVEEENIYKKLDRILQIIKIVYGYVLGIPLSTSRLRPRAPTEVARICLPDHKTKEYVIEYDPKVLEDFLDYRIPDETFIVFETPNDGQNNFIMGVDSSTAPINIIIPNITRRPLSLIVNTVVGITEREGKPLLFPRPETIEKLDSYSAEEEGFLIRPDTLSSYPDYYRDRIREAQMNYLEYKFIDKALSPEPSDSDLYGKLKRPPNIVFLDGRIFPYEHKLSDYVALHGKYVRKSIYAYVRLIRAADALRDIATITGVVKRGHLAYLWYIISWYMFRKEGLINEDEFLDPSSLITEDDEMRDEYIALLILKKFYDPNRKELPRTFILIRRFYAMDPVLRRAIGLTDSISKENDIMFWFKEATISEYVEEKGLAGYVKDKGLEEDEAWFYAEACARGAVAMFYYVPPMPIKALDHKRIRIPRYEVLIPSSFINLELRSMHKKIKEIVRETIFDGRIDKDFFVGYDEAKEGFILIVPSYIKIAHYYAKNMEKILKKYYGIYLLNKAMEFIRELEKLFFES